MSGKVSVLIPSREERFLSPTIHDVFRNASGEIEVVVHLDGYWPGDWKELTAQYPNLHTVHSGQSVGMRGGINKATASAITRGAKYLFKLDAHCAVGEGFDEILKAECDSDWVVVPRRLRLDPENWIIAEPEKPPHDYHYLSFPDDPQDFGGPGLNGKPWVERQKARADILLDEEMSSQGSAWFMHADYFQRLELMDEASYGPFWNEFQEIGLKCWLSGGKVMVNKKTHYAHLHKGKKYGRGYRLDESALTQGRNHTMKWIWNEAWDKQTLPFKWLIEYFWPVPTWSENWEEILYASRSPRVLGSAISRREQLPGVRQEANGLVITSARYGVLGSLPPFSEHSIDVVERVRSLVKDGTLDIIVNNSTLTPSSNPFRGKKKVLLLTYAYNGGEPVTIEREEKDWLIIGQAQRQVPRTPESEIAWSKVQKVAAEIEEAYESAKSKAAAGMAESELDLTPRAIRKSFAAGEVKPMSATALNDYLIRKFSISPQRLKAPMPIELNNFHRNDLAQLFAELGFKRGAEIGVAEGNYSEVLLKANPECELLLIDPWHAYSENPQNKTKEKHQFAWAETKRKIGLYKKAQMLVERSMDAINFVLDESLDFVYIDGNHSFDFVMQDLIEWSKRVRSGGIVSGDDYYQLDQKRWVGGGVVEAVQAYVNAHRIPIWWLFQGHKSIDFMWCKP